MRGNHDLRNVFEGNSMQQWVLHNIHQPGKERLSHQLSPGVSLPTRERRSTAFTAIPTNRKKDIEMRNFRTVVCSVALMWVLAAQAFVPEIDLKDAKVVSEGQCATMGRLYKCFLVEDKDKHYIVVVDSAGFLAIYKVSGKKADYDEAEVEIVWQRAPTRRKDEV